MSVWQIVMLYCAFMLATMLGMIQDCRRYGEKPCDCGGDGFGLVMLLGLLWPIMVWYLVGRYVGPFLVMERTFKRKKELSP